MIITIKPEWNYDGEETQVEAEDLSVLLKPGNHKYLLCTTDQAPGNRKFYIMHSSTPELALRKFRMLNKHLCCEVVGQIDGDTEPKYDIVLKEKPIEEGLTRDDIDQLIDMINCDEVFPFEVVSLQGSAALGFISTVASDKLDYLHKGISQFIASILTDMEKESPDNQYEYEGLKIWLSR